MANPRNLSDLAPLVSVLNNTVSFSGGLSVTGDLTVSGTSYTVNSTTVTIDDPVLTLGGDTAPTTDDNKDRGVEFRWHNGTASKLGYFGYDDSTGKFTFIPDATNTGEVFSGTKGTLDANLEWTDVLNKPSPQITVSLTGDVSGTANTTLTSLANGTINITTAIQPNSVSLGTDTVGDYAASVGVSGVGLSLTGVAGEGTAYTITSNATSLNTGGAIVSRDANGDFAARNITASKILTGTIDSSGIISVLNGSAAQGIKVGNLVVSNSYSDGAPTDGIYVKGQLQSAVGSGTAPFIVASTTKVTNLNADLLDDMTSSSSNTVSTIVARDSSGNFSAGTITASLTGTATSSTNLVTSDDRSKAPADDTAGRLRFGFTAWNNNNTDPWADYLHLRSYTDSSGGADNLVMFLKNGIGMRIWQQSWGSASAYSVYKDVAFTDGSNSSGTWSISTTGNAGSVSKLILSNNSSVSDAVADNAIGYVSGISLFSETDGALYSQFYSGSWQHQIFGDYRTGQIAVRGKNSGTWQNWRSVLDSVNVGTYALPIGGGTLTGTLKINTSSSGSASSHVIIKRSGAAEPASFGSYTGSWRSGLEIWNNNSTRMLFLNPSETDYNYASIKSVGGGIDFGVGSNGSTSALKLEDNGTVVAGTVRTTQVSTPYHSLSSVFYSNTEAPSTGYLITTNITYDVFNMPTVIIEGYAYGSGVPIHLEIVWYSYNNGFVSASYTNLGSWDPGTVTVGTNSNGKVCLHLSNNIYYGRFSVRCIHDQGSPSLENWTVTAATTSGLSRLTTVPLTVVRSDIAAPNSVTAPIYYDTNNPNYFANPGSNSVFSQLTLGTTTQTDVSLGINGYTHISGTNFLYFGGTIGNQNSWGSRDYTSGGVRYINSNGFIFNNDGYGSTWSFSANTSGNITSSVDLRTPILYDSNNTGYYFDGASTSLLNYLSVGNHIKQGNMGRPNVEWNTGGTSSGMVIFYLPGTTSNYGMVHMVFDIYEYVTNRTATVIIGGHNWSGGWYEVGCNVVGYTGKSVRLGVKDGRFCVVFGTSGSSWSYGTIALRKIHNGGFYNNIMDMNGNWSTLQTTTESFSSITSDLTVLRTPGAIIAESGIYGTGFYKQGNTGYYLDPTGSTSLRTIGSWRSDSSTWDGEFAGKIQYHSNSWYHQYQDWFFLRNSAGTNVVQINSAGYMGVGGVNPTARMAGTSGISIYHPSTPAVGLASDSRDWLIYTSTDQGFKIWTPSQGDRVAVYSSYTQITSEARSPVFSDLDNSSYWWDPNNTSSHRFGTPSGWINIGPQNTSHCHITTDRSNFYFNTDIQVHGTIRHYNDTTNRFDVGTLVLRSNNPTIYLRDTDNSSAMLHCNSSLFYILRGGADTESWGQVGSYWPAYWDLTNNNATFGGSLWCAGNVTAYSDEKLKKNWSTLSSDFVERLAEVKNGTYDRIDIVARQVGVSAQSLKVVLPEAVDYHEKEDLLSVNYGGAALASAVELAKRLVLQEKRIKALEDLVNKLLGV
jgi:hypothetical protein